MTEPDPPGYTRLKLPTLQTMIDDMEESDGPDYRRYIRMEMFLSSKTVKIDLFAILTAVLKTIQNLDPKCTLLKLDESDDLKLTSLKNFGPVFDEYCKYHVRKTYTGQKVTEL